MKTLLIVGLLTIAATAKVAAQPSGTTRSDTATHLQANTGAPSASAYKLDMPHPRLLPMPLLMPPKAALPLDFGEVSLGMYREHTDKKMLALWLRESDMSTFARAYDKSRSDMLRVTDVDRVLTGVGMAMQAALWTMIFKQAFWGKRSGNDIRLDIGNGARTPTGAGGAGRAPYSPPPGTGIPPVRGKN